MQNNFIPEVCNFVTHGFFLALVLISLPQVLHHLKGKVSRNVINQTPSL